MQIIEQTGLGVRSAVMTFGRPDSATKFVVIPMLHIATPEFYLDVQRRLSKCDVVVDEGVKGWRTGIVTLAYSLAGRYRRNGLIEQSRGLDMAALPGQVVRPDISAAEFAAGCAGLARWFRWSLFVLAPLVGLWMLIVGPMRLLGSHLSLDDLPSAREEEYADDTLDALLLDTCDRGLVDELRRQADEHEHDARPWTVGVCWGAEHVRAIAPALIARGYQVRDAHWVTVL